MRERINYSIQHWGENIVDFFSGCPVYYINVSSTRIQFSIW